jgi:hypothetical protein
MLTFQNLSWKMWLSTGIMGVFPSSRIHSLRLGSLDGSKVSCPCQLWNSTLTLTFIWKKKQKAKYSRSFTAVRCALLEPNLYTVDINLTSRHPWCNAPSDIYAKENFIRSWGCRGSGQILKLIVEIIHSRGVGDYVVLVWKVFGIDNGSILIPQCSHCRMISSFGLSNENFLESPDAEQRTWKPQEGASKIVLNGRLALQMLMASNTLSIPNSGFHPRMA